LHFGRNPTPFPKTPQKAKRHSAEWRFALLQRSLASPEQDWAVLVHRTDCRLPRLGLPFAGRSWAVALAGFLLCFELPRDQQPQHHWRLLNSNRCAVQKNL
jgi:hypothetical protein